MAMQCSVSVKKEEDLAFFEPVKEERVESELRPSFIDFVFKQEHHEEEEEEFKPNIIKQELFNSPAKKEEPSASTPPLEFTSQIPVTENLNDCVRESLKDVLPTQRMRLCLRRCREKTFLTGKRRDTFSGQSESEDNDTNDPNWRPHKVISAASSIHVLRRSCTHPKKSKNTKVLHQKRGATSVKQSLSSVLPTCSDRKQKKGKKAEPSPPTVKSGKPRKHPCKTCGKAFLSKRDLNRHEHIHTGAKPFSCSMCERSFNDRGNMRKHMAVHTGAQPYSCSLCRRAFSERGNLRRHNFYVHKIEDDDHRNWGPLWHQCPNCLRTFKYQESLNRHLNSSCKEKKV